MKSPPSTGRGWVLTQEAFEAMLAWLDPEREQAANRYEEIRRRLIKFFTCRNCSTASEDLTDETINRVARKVQEELNHTYVGETAPYFYGVAHKVYLEYVKRPPALSPPARRETEEVEREHACLELCMRKLRPRSRDLIREFYQGEKQAKIEHRKQLAERLGISPNALRIQAHRIRLFLLECVRRCLSENELL